MPPSQNQKTSSTRYGRFSESLEQQKRAHSHRVLATEQQGVVFSSNDYLGLSKHPQVIEGARRALETLGFGSGSARTLAHLPLHREFEEKLAKYLKREKALLFSSGYQLNSTLLKALGTDETLFFLDKYCHRSLIEGAQNSGGKMFRFRHNDLSHLEDLLKKHRGEGKEAWIVTESLFSMHGTRADLPALIELKNRFDAFLIVDEAHAVGALGELGRGLSTPEVDLVVGGLGKAFGGFGGFVAGDAVLINYLLNFSPGFLFTTALPPAIVGGLIEGVKLLPTLEKERDKLKKNALLLRQELDLHQGDYIVPFPAGSAEKALYLSDAMKRGGYEVPAIRPPTVPPQHSILRFSVTADQTEETLRAAATYFRGHLTLQCPSA